MKLLDFWKDESGVFVVDYSVMTAMVVGLGLAVTVIVAGGAEDLTGETQRDLVAFDAGGGFDEMQEILE